MRVAGDNEGEVVEVRPAVTRVVEAARRLDGVGLGRSASSLIRWSFLKRRGATPGGPPVVFGPNEVRAFCDEFFAVPGQEPYRWYDPFERGWLRDATNGGWPIGTVWTQLKRPNQRLRALVKVEELDHAEVSAALIDESYAANLADIVKHSAKLSLLELAIWRYRFGVPEGAATGGALAEVLAGELSLSDEELLVVFGGPAPWGAGDDIPQIEEDWPDDALGERLLPLPIPPSRGGPPFVQEPPPAPPESTNGDYRELEPFAQLPLESGDVEGLIGQVESEVSELGLLLPDDALVAQCVLALLTGHLVLQGPPGTGKTTLARALARAFDCSSELQTATADWSTYDVIGGLQPSVGDSGTEVLKPWLGHVPRAALACLERAREHEDDPATQPFQGHWLIIDEFSRAQVDKAIGGLYTVLGGSGEQHLRLWFEPDPTRQAIPVPRRFRLIGTMNDVDASFVYDLSQGLSRRFQFVYVGVPPQHEVGAELKTALAKTARWLVDEYPTRAGTPDDQALLGRWSTQENIAAVRDVLWKVVVQLRYPPEGAPHGGWPLGTAQVCDVLRPVALCEGSSTTADLLPVLDAAIADRIVPQMSGVSPIVLEDFIDWLGSADSPSLVRTQEATRHLQDTSATF